ncbi:uncharacterized protein LOC125044171 [Penaeus chinensis]|uniref:uncharacterized protein LOC125044171 n=1 Tax=Penaeus chinensis TaxID=139456 RepID=UPI001FB6D036|nr:uncharacterized protein LOC125044171 [Penaeus chinensis]
MLLTIGYATLFVKFEILQVRLVVSLTTLLVLYTLFNNTSDTLPTTAYVKMVDLWFFFSIFVLFFIIILHVALEYVPTTPFKITKVFPTNGEWGKAPKNPVASWEFGRSPEAVLKITRKYIIPITMFVFNLVYWLVIFN